MIIELRRFDCDEIHVDRDGTVVAPADGQGFNVNMGGATLHFQSEHDAKKMAEKILHRLGFDVVAAKK